MSAPLVEKIYFVILMLELYSLYQISRFLRTRQGGERWVHARGPLRSLFPLFITNIK
jgi:hypothetical protein